MWRNNNQSYSEFLELVLHIVAVIFVLILVAYAISAYRTVAEVRFLVNHTIIRVLDVIGYY